MVIYRRRHMFGPLSGLAHPFLIWPVELGESSTGVTDLLRFQQDDGLNMALREI